MVERKINVTKGNVRGGSKMEDAKPIPPKRPPVQPGTGGKGGGSVGSKKSK